MAQGWSVDATDDEITFYEPPAVGTGNIVVTEYAKGAFGGTDVWAVGLWSGRYGYPSEIEFYADRLWLAGSKAEPQRIDGSCIGDYPNFGRSSPIVDSDAVSFTINTRQVNAIKDLIPLDSLLVLTTGGEFLMTGGQDNVVTPSTINIKPQSYYGTGDVQSKTLGESAVYIQKQGNKIRDLGYQFEKDGFRGNDISIWADHLIEGYSFERMEFAPAPWPILWFARNDGVLVGCTYMPEQEVVGWHRHDTGRSLEDAASGDGTVLDVCCLPGDDETETYYLVSREVGGETVQYIEQMAPTRYDDPRDYFYVDSGLTYDGRNTGATTLTLTAAGWTEDDEITITADAAIFTGASDVGDGFAISLGDVSVRLVITGYTDTTHVKARSIGTVPASLRAVALTGWVFQRDTISGLDHLEGKTVVGLSDGGVFGDKVVTDGAISLDTPGGVVQVGLPYRAHIETLEVNSAGGESMRGKNKLTYQVDLQVRKTVGVKVGPIWQLDEIPQREFEDYGTAVGESSGVLKKNISADWNRDGGHVHIVSDAPMPMEILSIAPKVAASD